MTPHGIIFDIKRFAVHDGPGVRSVVYLKGCPLNCAWCHNPEGKQRQFELVRFENRCIQCGACVTACPNGAHSVVDGKMIYHRELCEQCGRCLEVCYAEALFMYGRKVSVEDVMTTVRLDKAFYRDSIGGVTLSGGEPLAQPEFTTALLRQCKEESYHTALDTSGFVAWSTLEAALPYTDLVLYDLKHLEPEPHQRYTGVDNALILDNLRRIARRRVPLEIRIPIVPTVNDGANLTAAGAFLQQLEGQVTVRLLPYHNLAGGKYLHLGRENKMHVIEPPNRDGMQAAADVLKSFGCDVFIE